MTKITYWRTYILDSERRTREIICVYFYGLYFFSFLLLALYRYFPDVGSYLIEKCYNTDPGIHMDSSRMICPRTFSTGIINKKNPAPIFERFNRTDYVINTFWKLQSFFFFCRCLISLLCITTARYSEKLLQNYRINKTSSKRPLKTTGKFKFNCVYN